MQFLAFLPELFYFSSKNEGFLKKSEEINEKSEMGILILLATNNTNENDFLINHRKNGWTRKKITKNDIKADQGGSSISFR